MTQYINKATLEEKIDKLDNQDFSVIDDLSGRAAYLRAIEDFYKILDTLEVKEVNLEKELDRIWFDNKLGNYFNNDAMDFGHIRTLCRHFFELGLKVQKGE